MFLFSLLYVRFVRRFTCNYLALVTERWLWRLLKLSIGITDDATGIDIPLSDISVGFRIIPVPNWVSLFR
jgi:hypothetical protein